MKSIIVYINSMSNAGGIERVISNLLFEWSKKYKVYLLVKDDTASSFYDLPDNIIKLSINTPIKMDMNSRIRRILAVIKNISKSIRELKKCLLSIDFDYIYTTTPLNSFEVLLANRKYLKKLIISEHASAFAVNKVYAAMKRYIYPKALCISVPNRMDCNVYEKWGSNVIYIPHLNTFPIRKRNECDTKIAINIGRLTSDKRQDELLKIWSAVSNLNWQLWIVGSGEEEERLRQLISSYKLQDSVMLLGHRQNITEIYEKASLFLFTSRMEGFGMVLLEAMSFGIPCISYDCPSGPRDIIKDGTNGYLIENNNTGCFINKLENILSMNSLETLSIGAFETATNWDNEEILNLWDSVFSM